MCSPAAYRLNGHMKFAKITFTGVETHNFFRSHDRLT